MTVTEGDIETRRAWWDEKVRAWAKSGLRQGQYCEREGLSYHAFQHYRRKWIERLRKQRQPQAATSVSVVEVGTVVDLSQLANHSPLGRSSGVVLDFGAFRVTLEEGFSQQALSQVLGVLQRG